VLLTLLLRLIEMHNKSILAAISLLLSIGGWFLWNIILSAIYNPANKIYHVRDSFFSTFGKSGLWWFTLILIVSCAIVFEFGVSSLRAAWFPTDADTFQALEQDLEIRKRFEEAASLELRQGWDRGKKKTSFEIRKEEEEERQRNEEQEKREAEVREILRSRPDGPASEAAVRQSKRMSTQDIIDEVGRTSVDISEMLSKRFGSVRRE
jgi:phospholipid-translocating ATPase